MHKLSALEPRDVFYYFERLSSVPHGSGNTKMISDLCKETASELGLDCTQDALGSLIIKKEGSAGYENSAPVILQGHIDMVCTKAPDCTKDMANEPVELCTDGEWVWANGTSLGGDDLIGCAMIFAILADNTLSHPPIEAVLTVDEETGMDGAFSLDYSLLSGRTLINLDSEKEDTFIVSCAGGLGVNCSVPVGFSPCNGEGFRVTVGGLLGGHSGADIAKGRGNAILLLARALLSAAEKFGVRLSMISGGKFHNVICSEATALVSVPQEKASEFKEFIAYFDTVLKNELSRHDVGVFITANRASAASAMTETDTLRVLRALFSVPNGVVSMSADFPEIPETSLNIGSVSTTEKGVIFTALLRSQFASQKEYMFEKLNTVLTLVGGKADKKDGYPGWQYSPSSPVRDKVIKAYRSVTGRDGTVTITHGGVECGIFAENLPSLDAVSIGPDCFDIHSCSERVSVPSTGVIYEVLKKVLADCK